MEPESRRDPLARERARRRRAKQVQRRRLVLLLGILGLIVVIVVLSIALSGDDGQTTVGTSSATALEGTTDTSDGAGSTPVDVSSSTYAAVLTGDQSVPAVKTVAAAELLVTYNKDQGTLAYVLDITSMLTRPTVATIYEGAPGTSGAAVVTLFAGPEAGTTFEGVLAEGFIEETDLKGSLQGSKLEDLVALLASGNAYVSIGNASHPVDAIRGQIKLQSLLNITE